MAQWMAPIAVLVIAVLGFLGTGFWSGLHRVPEGFLGVYFRFGALLPDVTTPGLQYCNGWTTKVARIPITFQTETLSNTPCGTNGGVVIYFEKIEIVYRTVPSQVLSLVKEFGLGYSDIWIRARVQSEVNQFCSKYDLHSIYISEFSQMDERLVSALRKDLPNSIEIIAVRITKPSIPAQIQENFVEMERIKSQRLVVEQTRQTTLRQAETDRRKAVIEAEKQAALKLHTTGRRLNRTIAAESVRAIDAQMEATKIRTQADALLYRHLREADVNERRLTPQYLAFLRAAKTFSNTRMFIGEAIPDFFVAEENASP